MWAVVARNEHVTGQEHTRKPVMLPRCSRSVQGSIDGMAVKGVQLSLDGVELHSEHVPMGGAARCLELGLGARSRQLERSPLRGALALGRGERSAQDDLVVRVLLLRLDALALPAASHQRELSMVLGALVSGFSRGSFRSIRGRRRTIPRASIRGPSEAVVGSTRSSRGSEERQKAEGKRQNERDREESLTSTFVCCLLRFVFPEAPTCRSRSQDGGWR